MRTTVTILNSMAGRDFEQALDQHVAWGIQHLDLKDAIFGKGITSLTLDEAAQAQTLIQARGLTTYCLSTGLFHREVESGEAIFSEHALDLLDHVLALAAILKPQFIRLLAATTHKRSELQDSIAYLCAEHPWLFGMYTEAIDRLASEGYRVTIENEVGGCILATPQEIIDFFEAIDRPDKVCLTWDVQNLWQMGIYPSLAVYDQLKRLMGYYHLKGGQQGEDTSELRWRSSLQDATWPVAEITHRVVRDGVSPVICLNPSHGRLQEGYDNHDLVQRDLKFARRTIAEVEG